MEYRTDMALEVAPKDTKGVTIKESSLLRGVKRTDIHVTNDLAAATIKKPKGRYITVECKDLYNKDLELKNYCAQMLAGAIKDCIRGLTEGTVLVVGLGNKRMTADSLGPMVADKVIVTRHIEEDLIKRGRLSSLCAIAPGVLGITGIETYDVIKGVCERVKPNLVIVIDALAARKTERISSSFQVTDTGIVPGAGVYNRRYALSKDTLGVPVISVGVPLVVFAWSLAMDIVGETLKTNPEILPQNDERTNALIGGVMTNTLGDLVVTPKDIDAIVEDCAYVTALAVNLAVHKNLSSDEVIAYMHT